VPRELSQEAKQKLSEIATRRHRNGELKAPGVENSRKGGLTAGSGRSKRSQRITKRVAEAAEEERNAQAIIEVFRDAIHPNQPMSIRLKGAETWAKIAAEHHKTEVQEIAQAGAQKSRDELIAILSEKLTEGPTASLIRGQIAEVSEGDIIDAEVVEE
jgi:hypothetical protein